MINETAQSIISHVEKSLQLLGNASYELEEAEIEDIPNAYHLRISLDATIKQTVALLDDLYSIND